MREENMVENHVNGFATLRFLLGRKPTWWTQETFTLLFDIATDHVDTRKLVKPALRSRSQTLPSSARVLAPRIEVIHMLMALMVQLAEECNVDLIRSVIVAFADLINSYNSNLQLLRRQLVPGTHKPVLCRGTRMAAACFCSSMLWCIPYSISYQLRPKPNSVGTGPSSDL